MTRKGLVKAAMILVRRKRRIILARTATPIPSFLTYACFSLGALLDSIEIYRRLSKPSTA
jgi:hypothetical protein|tara:strand:- start:517 stop:696 length:180 start_codon:yes stop_codon:yes gene_type:complete